MLALRYWELISARAHAYGELVVCEIIAFEASGTFAVMLSSIILPDLFVADVSLCGNGGLSR